MNILITGSSKGIGYALAKKMASVHDTNLYLISRSADLLESIKAECKKISQNTKIKTIAYDLERLINEDLPAEIDCSHLDIIINNAGLLMRKNFDLLESSELLKMSAVNFFAPALLIHKCLNKMGGEKPTHVINIGSMGGYQGSAKFPGLAVYSATKSALATLTECLAVEYPDRNIYFNCLALGAVQTEMLDEAFPGYIAPVSADQMADYIADFAYNGYKYFNGKVIPVSFLTP